MLLLDHLLLEPLPLLAVDLDLGLGVPEPAVAEPLADQILVTDAEGLEALETPTASGTGNGG